VCTKSTSGFIPVWEKFDINIPSSEKLVEMAIFQILLSSDILNEGDAVKILAQ